MNNGAATSDNGYIALHDGTIANAGTWLIKNSTDTPFYNWTGLPTNAVTNTAAGTMTFTPPTTSDTVTLNSLPVANQGTFAVTRGRLLTSVGGSGTGTYNLASGTTLEQNAGRPGPRRRAVHRRRHPGPGGRRRHRLPGHPRQADAPRRQPQLQLHHPQQPAPSPSPLTPCRGCTTEPC